MKQKVIAIIPAAGSGKRFGAEGNKAFYEVLGKPIIIWVLERFQQSPAISEIIPVFSEVDMEKGLELIEQYSINKVRKIAPGGKERQDSVFHALKLIDDHLSIVLIHDGVRPIIDEETIQRCIQALKGCDGVVAGIPVTDTVKEVKGERAKRTLNRKELVAVQTPQVFRFDTLMNAYHEVKLRGSHHTDDAAVVEASKGRIVVVEGSNRNIKITTPDDIVVLEAYLRNGGLGPQFPDQQR